MFKRTPQQPPLPHSPIRPGQIYLNSMHTAHRELIKSMRDLKLRDQEIEHKLYQKLKASRKQPSRVALQDMLELKHMPEGRKDTSERRKDTPESRKDTSESRKDTSERRKEGQGRRTSQMDYSSAEKEDSFMSRKSKDRSNQIYRVIKQTHLQNIQELEMQEQQKTTSKTGKKVPKFNRSAVTPQKSRIASKYFVNAEEILPYSHTIKKEQNKVYLPVPRQVKQLLIEQHYKRNHQKYEHQSCKRSKDNTPYRAQLKHFQNYRSVYFTKETGEIQKNRNYEQSAVRNTLF